LDSIKFDNSPGENPVLGFFLVVSGFFPDFPGFSGKNSNGTMQHITGSISGQK